MSKSRYFKPIKTRFRDRKRRIELPGIDEDDKWIKCHVCGFHLNTDKLTLPQRGGDVYKDFAEEDLNIAGSGDKKKVMSIMDNFDMLGVVLELGLDGNPVTVYDVPRNSTTGAGCSFCGSTNF